ncbi:regulatory iron-sulfur-containing complex subunit RicT [Sphingobacterium sp. HMA12]|uniref:PSP1 domain-containing protein n=1 Tax=Sphingobacterium sp. HMA12 TaxID=2050894 RepID=UPI0018F7F389|nr:regulatory iron-sulfur-containing complex subunit RicT [Sphingobacterium sp. HMA12]
MGCGSCSSGGGCGTTTASGTPAGCQNNGSCMTSGCNKLDVYDWLSDMDMPSNYKPFNIVEVRFKGSRKDFFINVDNLYLEMGEMVVVEPSTGGYDVGHVSLTGELVRLQLKKNNVTPELVTKKIYRKPNEVDVEKYNAAKDLEWETMHKARKLALDLGLSMKISDVDYQGDKTKATFYYTAEGRVDFRELIKKMAEAFRIRIEMRQIGMRQEASRLGGIGSCGRELCCSTWLTDFKTVSTSAARYQNLSLNTLKLAGQCGKLKCCLNYELDSYMDALKDIPNNIDRIETLKGVAYLQKTDIFKKMMWFSFPGAENWIAMPVQQVKELVEMNKQGIKPEVISSAIETEDIREEKIVNYDYENVVGQDSLTRLDDRNKRKKKRKTKSNNNAKPENKNSQKSDKAEQNPPKQAVVKQQSNPDSAVTATAGKENKEGQNNRPKKRFNRHRNKNRGNNNNSASKPE